METNAEHSEKNAASEAAKALAALRWANKTPEQRREHANKMVAARRARRAI